MKHPISAAEADAQMPADLKGMKQKHPHTTAAGLKALTEVVEYGFRHSGMLNTVRTGLKLNQLGGFDCQSCAWPNPDEKRSAAEFCENGFKAVTYEVTKKRITPDFFREHSVAELAGQSDFWLGDQGRITEPFVLRPGGSHYEPISWDDAFQLVAGELHTLPSPNE